MFKVVLCVTWCCFSRLYRNPDLVFGVPLANRKGADARCTVGLLAKVMPFRLRLDPTMTFADALSALDIDLSKDLGHQRFPFHYINGMPRPHRRRTDGLYDVVVNSQRMDYGFSFGGASVTCSNCSSTFFVPWSITAFEYAADDAIHIVIDYDPGRISSEEASRFFRSFRAILRSAPESATVAIGRLPMVSAEECVALMRRGQGKRVSLPGTATLPMLLAHQAARSPNETALVCGEERLTYTAPRSCRPTGAEAHRTWRRPRHLGRHIPSAYRCFSCCNPRRAQGWWRIFIARSWPPAGTARNPWSRIRI